MLTCARRMLFAKVLMKLPSSSDSPNTSKASLVIVAMSAGSAARNFNASKGSKRTCGTGFRASRDPTKQILNNGAIICS